MYDKAINDASDCDTSEECIDRLDFDITDEVNAIVAGEIWIQFPQT